MEKDTYKYKVILNGKIIEVGITHDLKIRASDTKIRFPDAIVKQVGRKTTFQEAGEWEKEQSCMRA